VKIENNYLGLELKNLSEPGVLGRFAQIVLTPARQTYGRININTVSSLVADPTASNRPYTVFNTMMGLPGLIAAYDHVARSVVDMTPEARPFITDIFPPDTNFSPVHYAFMAGLEPSSNPFEEAVLSRAHKTMGARPEHIDGRYYEFPSDLPFYIRANWQYDEQNPDPFAYPLNAASVETPRQRFEEAMERYKRLANLVSTRSDVFEIIVTAQSGYLSNEDQNGDGRIDYRNDFVVTGERKIRVVYER